MSKMLIVAGIGLGLSAMAQAAPPRMLPGEWEIVTTMKMQSAGKMPPGMAAAMAQVQGKPIVIHQCITPAEAARGPETQPRDKNCTVQNVSYAGGRMQAESVCRHDGEMTRMKMTGVYTPNSYVMDGAMSGAGGKMMPMAMTMHIAGRRVAAVCSTKSK